MFVREIKTPNTIMQKTLGGDRLGAGKKMQVDLHGYTRSTFNLGKIWRSTMSAGTLVPFMSSVALPGDTWDIDLDCVVKTHPTIGPLFGSFKTQLDIFQAPFRLYNSWLHNNKLNIGRDMSQVKLPVFYMEVDNLPHPLPEGFDLNNSQINPSSLIAYLGVRGIGYAITGMTTTDRSFNAIPHLAYWEIYKNYYANKQEEIGAYIHQQFGAIINTINTIKVNTTTTIPQTPATPINLTLTAGDEFEIAYTGTTPLPSQVQLNTNIGLLILSDLATFSTGATPLTGTYNGRYGNIVIFAWNYLANNQPVNTPPIVVTFPLEYIDEMRETLLAAAGNTAFDIRSIGHPPYEGYLSKSNGYPSYISSQEGLAVKTYQSDIFNNWLNTDWLDGINGVNTRTAIDTTSGSFSLDTLLISRKMYDMLNRIMVSGGAYDDWLDAVYTTDRYKLCESPVYCGGLSKELVFQEVVSSNSSDTPDGEQPLGTLAGKGVMSNKHKGGKIIVKVVEPSYIIGIVSLTPRVDYSQGNRWDTHLKTMDDLHKPALDQIGFQDLLTEQQAWFSTQWDGVQWATYATGKQPAWINYMTEYNQTFGNFAIETNEMFMTLNRRYEFDDSVNSKVKDLTTYIDPAKYNFIFAQTSLDAQNYWVQIAIDCEVRRLMSSKIMPNL